VLVEQLIKHAEAPEELVSFDSVDEVIEYIKKMPCPTDDELRAHGMDPKKGVSFFSKCTNVGKRYIGV